MARQTSFLPSLLLALVSCTDRDPRRPVPLPEAQATRAAGADPDDPAEPGIPELARLARYVFRTMQRHEEVSPPDITMEAGNRPSRSDLAGPNAISVQKSV